MTDNQNEKVNIEYNNIALDDQFNVIYTITTPNSDSLLFLLKEVMISIADYNVDNWPDYSTWENILPDWYINKIKTYSFDDVDANDRVWEWKSWLDAMKYREWKWIASNSDSNNFYVYIEILSLPAIIEPFEFILFVLDIPIENIQYKEYW